MTSCNEQLIELRNKHVPPGVSLLSTAFIAKARGALTWTDAN